MEKLIPLAVRFLVCVVLGVVYFFLGGLFLLAFAVALFSGCDDAALYHVPEAGPGAEEGVRVRDPYDAGTQQPPEDCEIVVIWPGGPVEGQCSPGWLDTCTGSQVDPILPTESDQNCDGLNDGDCDRVAWATVLDTSGSMLGAGYLEAAEQALCDMPDDPRVLRALVTFGHTSHALGLAAGFGDELCDVTANTGGSSSEDGTRAAVFGIEDIGGWPPGYVRGVSIVTDLPPAGPTAINRVVNWCRDQSVTVDIVGKSNHADDWNPVVEACDGRFVVLLPWSGYEDIGGIPLPCEAAP